MANWRYILNVTPVIYAYGDSKYSNDPEGAGAFMAALLRGHAKRIANVGRLIGFPTERYAARFAKVTTTSGFNRVMADLYDAADQWFIWVEQFDKRKRSGPYEYRYYRYRGKSMVAITAPGGKTGRYEMSPAW